MSTRLLPLSVHVTCTAVEFTVFSSKAGALGAVEEIYYIHSQPYIGTCQSSLLFLKGMVLSSLTLLFPGTAIAIVKYSIYVLALVPKG